MNLRFLDSAMGVAIKVLLIVWVGINVAVVLWVLVTSLKSPSEIWNAPFALPATPLWSNFVDAWSLSGFAGAALNSLVIVVVASVLIVAIASPAAYALARSRRAAAVPLTTFFALGMGIPFQAVLVPLFLMSNAFSDFMIDWVTGAWDDRITLVIVYVALSLPFAVFVLTGYFRALPSELEEASAIDGLSPWRTFVSIMFPLARPGIITVLVLNVVSLWNETLLVLVLVPDPEQRTLPAALVNFYNTMQFTGNWGGLFAGIVIVIMPMVLLYLWVGRRIIDGMTQGIGK